MSRPASAQPQLLSRINERAVVRVLQSHGPCSRAEVTRQMDTSAPTVSKAVASLLKAGLVEEFDIKESGRGRPAKQLRLATKTAQVLGLVIDARQCRMVSAGIDGALREAERSFDTPSTYEDFLDAAAQCAEAFVGESAISTLGIGISVPGLVDYRSQKGILSPNVPITNGRSPGQDLGNLLGIECVTLQETHALCLAEHRYGEARGADDFAMLDVSTGLGLGVVSGGQVLTGHRGLAGEIGHIPMDGNELPCGCGRRGCLETLASDSALAAAVSRRDRQRLDIDEVIRRVAKGRLTIDDELRKVHRHLAFALATVINLFNPSTLFLYGRMFELDDDLFDRLVATTADMALVPSFEACRLVRARGSKRQGAVAGIIEYLTDSLVPTLPNTETSMFRDSANVDEARRKNGFRLVNRAGRD